MIRTYSELIKLPTFMDRFNYLKLEGEVGQDTFGWSRYLNQEFYRTPEWKRIRREVILRDEGRDLGCEDRPIGGMIIVHHMNPLTKRDILEGSEFLLSPEYLICVSRNTHDAITYSSDTLLIPEPVMRVPNDTCPWRR